MKQYVNPVELTAELLNTLIEKITVHEAVKLSLIHISWYWCAPSPAASQWQSAPGNIRGDAERRREEQHPKLPDGNGS